MVSLKRRNFILHIITGYLGTGGGSVSIKQESRSVLFLHFNYT